MDEERKNEQITLDPAEAEIENSEETAAVEYTDSEIAETEAESNPLTPEEEDFFASVDSYIEEPGETEEYQPPVEKKTPFFMKDAFLNDLIRITVGLIALVFSRMTFIGEPIKTVLAVAAALICGLPLILRAISDFSDKNYFNENVLVFIAGFLCVFTGYPVDAVIALLIADIGFRVRDTALEWYREEADKAAGGAASDNDRGLLDPLFRRIEQLFTPGCAFLAVIVALIALIFAGDSILPMLHRALAVLAASTPVMMSAVTALAFDFGKGRALEKGIRFTDVQSIKNASRLTSVVFNKTGTVTEGTYTVTGIYPVKISESQLIQLAAYAELYSEHPLAKAILQYYGQEVDPRFITQQREEKGSGSFVQLKSGAIVAVGNIELMEKLGVQGDMIPSDCVSVYVAVGKTFVGRIDFEDEIKPGVRESVMRIRKNGVANVALITGDNTLSATRIARSVDINEVYADCTPKDKFERIQYIAKSQEKDDRMGFIVSADSNIKAMELADLKIILGETDKNMPGMVVIPSGDTVGIPAIITEAKSITKLALICTIVLLSVKAISVILSVIGFFSISLVVALDLCAVVLVAFLTMFRQNKK